MKNIFLKLNWRLILIHTLAVCFFMYGVRQLFFFIYADEVKAMMAYMNGDSSSILKNFGDQKVTTIIMFLYFWPHFSMFIGMLLGSLTSFIISKRKKIFWLNSLFVLIISFLMIRVPVCNSYYIKLITTSVGFWFEKFGLEYVYFINGTLLTSLAVFLMFSKISRNTMLIK